MNMYLKSAVAGALALAATGAFALSAPSTGNSDLVLVVDNQTTNVAYALDTGISLNSLLPTGSLVTGAILNSTLAGINTSIAASSTLQAFLAQPGTFGWELEGAQYSTSSPNNADRAPGAAKAAYTSSLGGINPGAVSQQVLSNMNAFISGYSSDVVSGGLSTLTGTETNTASFSTTPGGALEKYGTLVGDTLNALGTTSQLFALTGNNGTGVLQTYIMGNVTLGTNGTLSITGNGTSPPPVPLPAAVWLFGSGLLGLVGVSRRRKSAVSLSN